jgi:hypothetical protein
MGLIFLELASSYRSGLISSESLNQSNRPCTSMVLLHSIATLGSTVSYLFISVALIS